MISLPSGGGAQSGIGETFSPDLHTGTGNFTVPLVFPSSRALTSDLAWVRLVHREVITQSKPFCLGSSHTTAQHVAVIFMAQDEIRARLAELAANDAKKPFTKALRALSILTLLCAFVVIGIAIVLQPSPALILARGLHILAVVGLLALAGAFITETMSMWWQDRRERQGYFDLKATRSKND